MAYKNAYGVAGSLTAPLPASGTALIAQLDMGTTALLQTLLAAGDWTFMQVGANTTAEVLQVFYSATNNFVVARQQDGSKLNAHVAGDPVVFSLTALAVAAEVTPPTQVPTATGLVTVDNTDPLAPAFHVEAPVFSSSGMSIIGSWPNYEFTLTGSDTSCCGGGSGSGSGGVSSILGYGLATVVQSSTTATISVAPPAFTGSGIAITGTWPNLVFTATTSSAGTVTSVAAGSGVTVTGSPSVAPVIGLAATGVSAGSYGSLTVNAFGQLTYIDPAFNPPSTVAGTTPINIVTSGHAITVSASAAAEGVVGVVALADSSSPLDPTDHTTAVNPALLASVVNSLAGASVAGFTNWSAEATGLYTNVVSGAPVLLDIPSGVSAVVRGSVTMVNATTPGTPVQFGIAIFNTTGPSMIQGNRSVTQSAQTMEIIIAGPFNSSLSLASTAVPSGASVVSSALTVVTY